MSAVLNLKKSLNKFCIICHLIFYIYYDIIFFETFRTFGKEELMSAERYRIIYPGCVFRAAVNYKNLVPPEDKWAEGALCLNDKGRYYILDRKAGSGGYGCADIFLDTLGLASGFLDGNRNDIFEGDILKITGFVPQCPEPVPDENGEITVPPVFRYECFYGEDEEEEEKQEREVFSEPPADCEETFSFEGVVFMSGGVFYLQYFDRESCSLNAVPLYLYFGPDMLPAYATAVQTEGNIYDDEELYSRVLGFSSAETAK